MSKIEIHKYTGTSIETGEMLVGQLFYYEGNESNPTDRPSVHIIGKNSILHAHSTNEVYASTIQPWCTSIVTIKCLKEES